MVTWMMGELIVHRKTFDKMVEGIYKDRRDQCLASVDSRFQQPRKDVIDKCRALNDRLNKLIQSVCDDAHKACADANRQVLPKLNGQIDAAAKLAGDTRAQLAATQQGATEQIFGAATTPLYQVAQRMNESVRHYFDQLMKDASQDSIVRLQKYIDRFRDASNDLAKIQNEIS